MIDPTAHFIWFGSRFPWMHVPALCSAVEKGGFERAVFHHADELERTPQLDTLRHAAGVEFRPFDPHEVLGSVPEVGEALVGLFRRLEQPAARANMVRAAILFRDGGVYLDTDTVCIRSLDDLRERGGVFCGEEPVCIPGSLRGSKNLRRHARSLLLQGLRELYRLSPQGWRGFRHVEHWYDHDVNNAVIGAEPGHPFVFELMRRMVSMPSEKQVIRFALGTHLLQESIQATTDEKVRVYPYPYFYPLGPEISQHWFRAGTAEFSDEMILPETRVVHWYASVRTKKVVPRIDPDFVKRTRDDRAISRLVADWA